jgi:predicted alpha/beta hydrolase family esterase
MSLTLAADPRGFSPDLFSIVTIAEAGARPPVWQSRLRWPDMGDSHIALEMNRPRRQSVWATQLDDAVMQADRAVLFVAEGVGCFAASWWARLSPSHYVSKVAGALLLDPVAPPRDQDQRPLFASPAVALPFPALVLTGEDRDFTADPALGAQVNAWGGRRLAGGRQRVSGDGSAWGSAQRLMRRISRAVIVNDIRRARALRGD